MLPVHPTEKRISRASLPKMQFCQGLLVLYWNLVHSHKAAAGILKQIKDSLRVPFYMKIVILMTWSIWTVGNDWIFNDTDPTVDICKRNFVKEMNLLLHRVKPEIGSMMNTWLHLL